MKWVKKEKGCRGCSGSKGHGKVWGPRDILKYAIWTSGTRRLIKYGCTKGHTTARCENCRLKRTSHLECKYPSIFDGILSRPPFNLVKLLSRLFRQGLRRKFASWNEIKMLKWFLKVGLSSLTLFWILKIESGRVISWSSLLW